MCVDGYACSCVEWIATLLVEFYDLFTVLMCRCHFILLFALVTVTVTHVRGIQIHALTHMYIYILYVCVVVPYKCICKYELRCLCKTLTTGVVK